uniref:uncharacterized protein LOC117609904 n=1 Tax=Osmia lignaria TaxID=473952 RepID=UPI001478E8B3|nr:uncharacterized protein LOC117609904 [Osmia lignaria]XP_034192657.1 uncharacterized protein LOC117609904 [Osmia lignaria]
MKIARVVTVCAALISTSLGAETERSKRRAQPKSQLPQPRIENISTTPVTFTTLRPDIRPFGSQIDPSVYPVGFRRRAPRIRTTRFASIRSRNNRHRRQLHRRGKKSRLGRSFDVTNSKKLELVHGPPDEIHLEPIYRVIKNKNIFDSIIDLIRRLIGSKKPLGPLVGPFHFPGVGDKVYVRLLEPVLPNHLVIRLVSHLPATEIEAAMEKHISPPIHIPKLSQIPSISHESFVVAPNELIDSFSKHSLAASDSLLSSSNHAVQTSKTAKKLDEKMLGNSWNNRVHISETYTKNDHRNSTNPQPLWSPEISRDDWKFIDPSNESSYQDSFNQVYESNKEPEVLKFSIEDFHDPLNVTDYQPSVNSFIPVRDYALNNEFKNAEVSPKYSLDFVSKKMRYLNLDGSVDSSEEKNDGSLKSVENSPIFSKVDREWGLVRRMRVRRKEIKTSSNSEKGVQERNSTEAFPEVDRKSDDDRSNYSMNKLRNNTVTGLKEDGNFGQRYKNNSTSVNTTKSESIKNSTESRGI